MVLIITPSQLPGFFCPTNASLDAEQKWLLISFDFDIEPSYFELSYLLEFQLTARIARASGGAHRAALTRRVGCDGVALDEFPKL